MYVVFPNDEFMLNVNAMVRLPEPVTFETVTARKKPVIVVTDSCREQTAAHHCSGHTLPVTGTAPREKPHFLGKPKHNEILASLADVPL